MFTTFRPIINKFVHNFLTTTENNELQELLNLDDHNHSFHEAINISHGVYGFSEFTPVSSSNDANNKNN